MYDDRTTLSKQVAADLRSFFGGQVFETIIPRNVRLAEAPSHGMPVMFYDIHSKGAEAYVQLAKEVIANAQKRVGQGSERADQGARAESAAAGAGGGTTVSGTSTIGDDGKSGGDGGSSSSGAS
jgi:hypothetical protein